MYTVFTIVAVTYDSSVLFEGQGVDIIPEVASSYRTVKGMMFSSIDQAFDFYSEYAKKVGFGVRKGGSYLHDGVLKTKYFTCCKEGHKPANICDSKVHDFFESHNHRMVADSNMKFVRFARKLTHVQKEAIYELSNMNLGPIKAFNLMRTQYGGFEKLSATKDDCKNFKQCLNCYIGEYDAEMIAQRLCANRTFSSEYSFEYDVNDDREYKMVFVPFTAIDNHCHSVTVGAGLLASETIELYTWLFQMLLKSFGSSPKVVVTDQGPAMKQAIASVFQIQGIGYFFLEVVFKKEGEFGEECTATCSCKRFEQYGLVCRHIFYVMNMYQVKKFLKRYINDRWRKEVVVNIRTVPMSEFGNDQNRKIKEISREIKYAGEYLINSYVADIDELI
ncbi:protein FAR1-RELATED SEQUENCE 5-like [Bidens hawaiensis]|uniref:protein FAR1-RELATED SEQUENCE 5-like n=1 Tax=Bidens hawaiensis TaxID=980011 RepID=UPI00404B0614